MSLLKRWFSQTRSVAESISIVLRRQIPIRLDEEALSWLGGLPRVPIGTKWPRGTTNKPLHFVAQIDCAGLPQELWGGLGPRKGWLLLFVDVEAANEQEDRPIARVIHVAELGPEAEPPADLCFARRDVFDVNKVSGTVPGAQRRHFRKWPVDLVATAVNTSELTGSELYGAPENDLIISAHDSYAGDRPTTWRGAYTILAELANAHSASENESHWRGNSGGLLDYPEPDSNDFNQDWAERRRRLPEWDQVGAFPAADNRLKSQMYEERRVGCDLPLSFHPAAIRASAFVTPCGAG